MSERMREIVDWLVEFTSESDVRRRGRDGIF